MELPKKRKWMLLFSNFSAIFLLSAGCSVTSKVPLSEKEKVGNPSNNVNQEQKPDQPKEKIEKPIILQKPEITPEPKPVPLPPKNPNILPKPSKKPKDDRPPEIEISKDQPISPEPKKVPVQKKPVDSADKQEKPIVKVFNPREEQKESDIQLARLKGHLSTLPNALYVNAFMQKYRPLTIIHNGNTSHKNFSYGSFVNPIQGLDEEKYDAKLDFSNAKSPKNGEKDPIDGVFLVLTLKGNPTVTDSKKVNILYNENQNEFSLKKKNLPQGFENVFPSFLAFALLNKDKDEVISLPFFNKLDFILNDQNFGVGLKDAFVEFNKSDIDKNKYGFDIVSAQPDDENGTLKLNLELWKIPDGSENKEFFPKIESVEFSGLAKNSSNIYEIGLAKQDLELKLLKGELNKSLSDNNLNSDFTKNAFLKELLDNLHVRIKANVNSKWVKLTETKSEKWLVYPQVQYANLDSTQLTDKLKLTKKENKISWELELESFLLENGQTLTPKGEFLFGNKKTHKITGEFDLNQV